MLHKPASLASVIFVLTLTGGTAMATNAHDFDFTSIDGEPLPMSTFEGKAVLVVNTASFCGLTPQYEGLQSLWNEYREQGLVVLGVPSNDFGAQEPKAEADIKEFCEVNFNVDFPLTSKNVVKGDDAHPFYQWAAEELGDDATPKWNFHKYLVAPDGTLVKSIASTTKPDDDEVITAIEANLP